MSIAGKHLVKWNRPVTEGSTLVYRSKCGRFKITKRSFSNMSGRNGHVNQKAYIFVSPTTGTRADCETLADAKQHVDWEIDPNHDAFA